jgi:hypothetical protein
MRPINILGENMSTGLIKGLAAIQDAVESRNQDFGDGAKWFKLDSGKSAKVWFLQEFDENSPNYNEKAGTIVLAVEHSSPANFMKKALCTKDEDGKCFACEMNRANPKKGWNQKMRLYANVLVNNGKDEPFVAILSQGIGPKSITPALAEMANEYNGVTGTQFQIKRVGEKMETSYTIFPLPGGEAPDVASLELYDLEKVATRKVPYEEQAEFYEVDTSEPVTEADKDFEW